MDKTELLWACTRRLLQDFSFPSLQLAINVITPKQHVQVLGVSLRVLHTALAIIRYTNPRFTYLLTYF